MVTSALPGRGYDGSAASYGYASASPFGIASPTAARVQEIFLGDLKALL